MRIARIVMAGALLASGQMVSAQQIKVDESAWDNSGAMPRPKQIDIALPRATGSTKLFELRSGSDKGLDNIALYSSDDGKVYSTIYVYRAGMPDPSYAMIMTTTAITKRYKTAVAGAETLVRVAGVPALHRRVFEGAVEPDGTRIAALAGTMRVGDWIVKLRATGPEARAEEVNAVFAAMVSGLRFGSGVTPAISVIDRVGECPATGAAPSAARIATSDVAALARALPEAVRPRTPAAPRELCVMGRGKDAEGVEVVLSEGGLGRPTVMLLGDAGDGIMVVPEQPGVHGWGLATAVAGEAVMFGPFDRAPGTRQLLAIIEDENSDWAGNAIAVQTVTAEGKVEFEM